MKTEPNEPIHPLIETQERAGETFYTDTFSTGGLTKREYFAAMAMQGLLTNYVSYGLYGNHESQPNVHVQAIMCADQLIEELNK